MPDSERIAALEQELSQLKAALATTIPKLEGNCYALSMMLARTASFLPVPDVLFQDLLEDVEGSTLFSGMSEGLRDNSVAATREIYAALLSMRRGMAEMDLKRLPE